MENATRPLPPDRSEGCFNCGSGKNAVLVSLLCNNASIALCLKCRLLPPNQLHTQPFKSRQV